MELQNVWETSVQEGKCLVASEFCSRHIITCKAEHSEPVVQADQLLIEFCFTLSDQIVGEIWLVD